MMNRTLKVLLLGITASVMLATSALAEWVYVTPNGKKYHPENSRFSKMESAQRISLEEAEERGLEPSKAYLRFEQELKEAKTAPKAK